MMKHHASTQLHQNAGAYARHLPRLNARPVYKSDFSPDHWVVVVVSPATPQGQLMDTGSRTRRARTPRTEDEGKIHTIHHAVGVDVRSADPEVFANRDVVGTIEGSVAVEVTWN